ncbi:MAG TPA: HEAT repeat domain-containing protein [Anaerolineales bacterium]|nr:HEAT repeat domain-containing protein [Anaerolineales bacterium]HNO31510.1 HEAT repeat domain-containing protein [Anaerolineales bacterium]
MQSLLADLTSGDDARAERAVSALAKLGEPVLPALLDLTHSEEADTRWWAVCALSASPHTRTRDLLPLLSDSAPEVRAAAALALCSHPGEEAVGSLANALKDRDSLTAGLAGNALVKIGTASVPKLLEIVNDAETSVRILVLRALSEISDHRAIPIMMKCLNNENESAVVQYWAQQGLERLGLDMVYIKP